MDLVFLSNSAIDLVRESYRDLSQRIISHELLGFVRLNEFGLEYVPERFDEFKKRFSPKKGSILEALNNYATALRSAA